MSRGTTTMKMISSTSTTSTSGVMLISDCRLELESPVLKCMMSFPPGPSGLGDQPHPAEAGLLDRGHGLPDLAEVELCVAPDHDFGIRLGTHCSAQGFAEMVGCDLPVIDPQPAGIVDGDQNPASLVTLVARLRSVRQVHVWSLPHLRRHHHEDDQQHEHYVDKRCDVDGRLHLGWFTEPHRLSPPSLPCPPALQPAGPGAPAP